MLQITRIDPTSLATVCALLGFFIGLLLGIFGASLSLSSEAVVYALPLLGAERMDSLIKSVLMSMGPLSIVLGSFFFALAGFIGGFIVAVIYNIAASRFGGIAFSVAEQVPPERPALQEVRNEKEMRRAAAEEAAVEESAEAQLQGMQQAPGEDVPEGTSPEEEEIPQPRRRAQRAY